MAHVYFPVHAAHPSQHSMTHAARRALQDEQRAHKAASMMVSPCELVLVRHGETAWNKEGRLQGQQQPGPPLDELGFQQAEVAARVLQQRFPRVDAVFSSDLLRAVQTAQVVAAAYKLTLSQHIGLRERDMGVLQGLTYTDAPHEQPAAWAAMQSDDSSTKLPGGESLDELRDRLTQAVLDIAAQHPGKRVVVVSHGGALHAIHRAARGYAAKGKVLNCSISVLLAESDEAIPAPPSKPLKQLSGKHYYHHSHNQQQQQQPNGTQCQQDGTTCHNDGHQHHHHHQPQQQPSQHQAQEHAEDEPSRPHKLLQKARSLSIQVNASDLSHISVVWCDPEAPCDGCSSDEEMSLAGNGAAAGGCDGSSSNSSNGHCCGTGGSACGSKTLRPSSSDITRFTRCGGGRVKGGRLALMSWNDAEALKAKHLESAKGFGGSSRAG